MKPPTTLSFHQCCSRISRTHSADVFQSSCTSWSSKIIALDTVESSQRIVGSDHESRERCVYSSKSATSSYGGWVASRLVTMKSRVRGATWAAYTWSPSHSI